MADVVVMGSLNMDLVVRAERIPRPGETVSGRDLVTVPGGKGANQAVAAAKLGLSVEMVGCVGQDAFGEALLESLTRQGVGIDNVRRIAGVSTGTAMIVLDAQGQNAIVVSPGANGRLDLEHVHAARDLIARSSYLLMQFEVPLPSVREAIRLAKELGKRVVLNPAPARSVEPDFWQGVYCIVVNESEAEILTHTSVSNLAGAETAGRVLYEWGIPVAIVTLGAQGAWVVSENLSVHVPARRVNVVDTTAAGDAFVGGIVAGFIKGLSLADAVRYATCAGTLATTVFGAQPSLPTADQVQAFYEQGY